MARPADLRRAGGWEHGTRSRYVSGCRCTGCRFANLRAYHEAERLAKAAAVALPPRTAVSTATCIRAGKLYKFTKGCPGIKGEPCPYGSYLRKDSTAGICARCRKRLVWNGTVDADQAAAHIRKMSRKGVGYKTLADVARVSPTIIFAIKRGEKKTIRKRTEERILSVDESCKADQALVSGLRARRQLRRLLARGFTKTDLARRLGQKGNPPSLQLLRGGRLMTAAKVAQVARLYRTIGTSPARRSAPIRPCSCARPIVLERTDTTYCAKCERPRRAA